MKSILILPGDGIGPEVTNATVQILKMLQHLGHLEVALTTAPIGGAAIDAYGQPYPEETRQAVAEADAVLLGAVGGPKWDHLPPGERPESGLLALRQDMGVFANLRPAQVLPTMNQFSTLKPELLEGLDLLIVRELTGGIYFGEPRGRESHQAFNTMVYTEQEIERIALRAFKAAENRDRRVTSIDKANVLEVSQLWRDVVTRVSRDYPEVKLEHLYVDNAAMQMVKAPKQFDVILAPNLFGDILSDLAAMLTGSIGLLPSASLNADNKGLYEPVHGSAPDIAGQNKANPIACILSLSMLLEHSFGDLVAAQRVRQAVDRVVRSNTKTLDMCHESKVNAVTTDGMTSAIVEALENP